MEKDLGHFSRGSEQRLDWDSPSAEPWVGMRRSLGGGVVWIDSISPPGLRIPNFPERSKTQPGDKFYYDSAWWVYGHDGWWHER